MRRQTICEQIEIVITTPNPEAFAEFEQQETAFASVRVVPIDHLVPLGKARAEAVRAATAPFVFLGETHSFAAVDSWAEKLVAKHREGWTIVVPGFKMQTPETTSVGRAFCSITATGWRRARQGKSNTGPSITHRVPQQH